MNLRTRVLLGLLVTSVDACADEHLHLPELDYESTRARIGVDDFASMPICVDDLAQIDERVTFIEDRVDVERHDPLEIYVLPFEDIPCADGVMSCYSRDTDQIFTLWGSIDHEIVHATTRKIDFPSLFWSEGAAEVLSGRATHRATVPLEPSLLDARELDNYLTAGHFSRFLVESYGWAKYARIIRGASFESVYERSASQMTAAYEAEAPYSYPAIDPCPFPELAQVDDGAWEETVRIDCRSAGTTQFEWVHGSSSPAAAVIRRVELSAGTYAFDLSAGSMLLLGCQTTELTQAPTPPSNGDLLNEADQGTGTLFPAAGTHILSLTDGVYRISILSPVLQPFEADLGIQRMD